MKIRPAHPDDAEAISALILSLADRFTLHPDGQGAETFLTTVQPAAIRGYIEDPAFDYRVAEEAGELLGAVALRQGHHLYHLFVTPAHQRRGLARQLWRQVREAAERAGNGEGFSVNASRVAVPVYRAFGFTSNGPLTEMQGVAFVPMVLRLDGKSTP